MRSDLMIACLALLLESVAKNRSEQFGFVNSQKANYLGIQSTMHYDKATHLVVGQQFCAIDSSLLLHNSDRVRRTANFLAAFSVVKVRKLCIAQHSVHTLSFLSVSVRREVHLD